jgi:hypothetical protein
VKQPTAQCGASGTCQVCVGDQVAHAGLILARRNQLVFLQASLHTGPDPLIEFLLKRTWGEHMRFSLTDGRAKHAVGDIGAQQLWQAGAAQPADLLKKGAEACKGGGREGSWVQLRHVLLQQRVRAAGVQEPRWCCRLPQQAEPYFPAVW